MRFFRHYLIPVCVLMFAMLSVSTLRAQDMPLSQVLIEGEDWKVVSEGHTFTDGEDCAVL